MTNSLLRLKAGRSDSWRFESLTLLFMYGYIQPIFRKMIGTRQSQDEEGGHDVRVGVFLVLVEGDVGRVTTHS